MLVAVARRSIGEICEEFGVTGRALRYYEDEQLLAPERRGTQRLYSDRDRARLAWILRGKRVGFSLAEIRDLLDLYDLGDDRRTQRRKTIERCRERIGALEEQRRDIDSTIADLNGFLTLLQNQTEE
jgi:DNA-binding transcriptional MerR regulator